MRKRLFVVYVVIIMAVLILSGCGGSTGSKSGLSFNAETIEGNKIDESVFKDYKLTMVNIWATYCNPCISEMPDLEALYEEVKDQDANILGIIIDTPDSANEDLARQIIEKTGVKYKNIIPDQKLIDGLLKDIQAVPTTVFVDSKGKIVGKALVGSMEKEQYKEKILELINK